MTPQPTGTFLWHMGFQSVPDLPELLIAALVRAELSARKILLGCGR